MSLLQNFYNLPIARKQFISLIVSQLVPILGIGIGSTFIINIGMRSQLLEQAKSEVAVADINYNIKINQMGFGFRGQSDNPSIIEAAVNYDSGKGITPGLKSEVKRILANEIKARKIEYATLVGKDSKIIVNANKERSGSEFNPENLVAEVVKNPQQIKASGTVAWSELSKEAPPLPGNFSNQDALIRYTATPVMLPGTKNVVGVLISGDIVNGKEVIVKETLRANGGGYSAIYFRQSSGEFALAKSLIQESSQDLNQAQANISLPESAKSLLTEAAVSPEGKPVTARLRIGSETYTVAAKSLPNKIIETENGQQLIYTDQPTAILVRGTSEVAINNLLAQSFLEQALVVLVALLLIFIWLRLFRRGITLPIENLQRTTQLFAEGKSSERASVFARDEVGQLAITFNAMADSITEQSQQKEQEARLALQLNEITSKMRETFSTEKILKSAVTNTREALKSDRVLFYRLDKNFRGTVIAEALTSNSISAFGQSLVNPYLVEDYTEQYEVGTVKVVENVAQEDWTKNLSQHLEPLAVKGFLVAPVFVNNKIYGLIAAHSCESPRKWQDIEINLFKQVAIQMGYTLEQAELVQTIEQGRQTAETVSQQERQEKMALQMQLLELLSDIEGAASGDLTVRADVREDEIGTVADFFNSIVESLRLIVMKVKTSSAQLNEAIGSNEGAIRQLASEAIAQSEEINQTLDAVEEMKQQMQAVAISAQKASSVAQNASLSATKSGVAMDMTVKNILHLRQTVGDTAKKVKRLGESTQDITRVVSLINQISMQTNLLAINVGIEAARAGEEALGFAAVAEEVAELAAKSAAATKEIELMVDNIRIETNELAEAMETGTNQVVEGTRIVEEAKNSLSQILEVSRQIDSLVQSISTATASGVQTSQTLSQLMREVAVSSKRTSESSLNISASLHKTVEISHELQDTVETFKVS